MISDEHLMNFCRALTDATRSGLPLNEAFEILSKSPKHGKFIARAANMVAGGSSLYEALEAQRIFPPVFIALVRAGEAGGKVDEFLSLYADCLEVRIKFKRQIFRALIYPAFTVIFAGALFLLISFKVFPIIFGTLITLGIVVPGQMVWMNKIARYLREYWSPIILFGFMAALIFRAFMASWPGRKIRALAGHLLPGFRFATKEARLYNIYTTMGILLKAGVPLSAMMDILLQFSQDDIIIHRHFSRMSKMFSNGKTFSESLAGFIPQEDLFNVEIAEKSGRLDETLLRIGKNHYDRHSHRLKLLVTGFKISSILIIAILSFGLLMALVLPSLSVLKGTQNFMPEQLNLSTFSNQKPRQSGALGAGLSNEQEMYDRTASFNEIQGKKIADLMQKSSIPKLNMNLFGAQQLQEEQGAKKKLGSIQPMKTIQFKKIEPTAIKSADAN